MKFTEACGLAVLLLLSVRVGAAQQNGAEPGFTVSATNITLPSSGSASIPITVNAVDGYTGVVFIRCTATPAAGVLEPYCEPPTSGPALSVTLTVSEPTVAGSIPITSLPEPALTSSLAHPDANGRGRWVLAGALILGLGIRKRRSRWLACLLFAVGALLGMTGLGACGGGGGETLTPGTYTYAVSAVDQSVPQKSASTTVTVTVPAGIPVQSGS